MSKYKGIAIFLVAIYAGYYFIVGSAPEREREGFKEAIDYKANDIILQVEDNEILDEKSEEYRDKTNAELESDINKLLETQNVLEFHAKDLKYEKAKIEAQRTERRLQLLINFKKMAYICIFL